MEQINEQDLASLKETPLIISVVRTPQVISLPAESNNKSQQCQLTIVFEREFKKARGIFPVVSRLLSLGTTIYKEVRRITMNYTNDAALSNKCNVSGRSVHKGLFELI